jgi:phosphoribosylanthranilate isomerase
VSDTRIKICGITTVEDAELAARVGADYIGVIFAESARRVDVRRAKQIREAAPETMLVGVFADAPFDEVVETAGAVGLDLIQLHGDESPAYADALYERSGKPIIKAFHNWKLPDTDKLREYSRTSFFLFDLHKNATNGNGRRRDLEEIWDAASRERRKGFRMFLAGALDERNVREALRRTNAFAVDVCRGIEKSPGVKDPEALRRFVSEVTG